MFTPISIRNLLDGGRQTLLSIMGISFAIILIFMQLGFLGAVLDTAVLFYNNLNFDLIARSPDYYHFADAKNFPRQYLARIKNVNGVQDVYPYHVSLGRWNYAEKSVQQAILVVGVDENVQTFLTKQTGVEVPNTGLLTQPSYILVDKKSRPDFLGSDNSQRFSDKDLGLRIELNQAECEVVGLFKMGTGLAANGAAMVNEQGFVGLYPGYGPDRVGFGLIQLEKDALLNPVELRSQIYRSLGTNFQSGSMPIVEVLTRNEVVAREQRHWLLDTPVGFIFLAGVAMSFIVGAIIVYIVLSADIMRQIGEYAILKAMGYRNGFLYRVVLEQAVLLGIASYGISFAVSLLLYHFVGAAANLPITMTLSKQLVVGFSSLLMCCFSAIVAMQKLRRADPADLF